MSPANAESTAFFMKLQGASFQEIGDLIGITKQSAWRLHKSAVKKFEKRKKCIHCDKKAGSDVLCDQQIILIVQTYQIKYPLLK